MKLVNYFFPILIILIILGAWIITKDQNQGNQSNFGIIETKFIENLTLANLDGNPIIIDNRATIGLQLAPECQDESYLEAESDYIVEAGVSNISINQTAKTKTINLLVVAWLKGNKENNRIQIITSLSEQGESATFEEGGVYKVHFWESNEKLFLFCEFAGIITLPYKNWYCHETDDGRNYHEKGKAMVFANGKLYGPYIDSCSTDLILDEVACSNEEKNIISEIYLCDTSCLNGACTF